MTRNTVIDQICPGLNANEIQIPYDNHRKVSSLVKRQQNINNYVKCVVKCQMCTQMSNV